MLQIKYTGNKCYFFIKCIQRREQRPVYRKLILLLFIVNASIFCVAVPGFVKRGQCVGQLETLR